MYCIGPGASASVGVKGWKPCASPPPRGRLKRRSDALGLTTNEARDIFDAIPKLRDRLDALCRVGLGYLKLGQQGTTLSGGEAQRVKLATELTKQSRDHTLFILDEPTRGIDIGAKAEVHQMIRELAKEGIAIICISSDLPEVLALSDRILVMREGRQMGILEGASADQESVMALAMGQ